MKVRLQIWPDGWSGRPTLTICINERKEEFVQSCGRRGAHQILERLRPELDSRKLDIDVQTIACLGLCAKGPNARLAPANSWFHQISPDDVAELATVLQHELAGIACTATEKPDLPASPNTTPTS